VASVDPKAVPAPSAPRGRAWLIVGLLFLIQVANFADKSVVGLAAGEIKRELGLSNSDYGVIAGSFFLLYAVGGLAVAWLAAGRFRPRHILAVLLAVWSLSQLPIVFAASLPMLIVCRVILGAGEGGGTPTGLNVCHEWFPSRERNFPGAVVMSGSIVGSLVAAPVLSYIIASLGWRAAFLACSIAGLVVLVCWLLGSADGPEAAWNAPGTRSAGPVPLRKIWLDRTIVGNLILGFCAYWIVGFQVAWLAPFVRDGLGFGLVATGWVLSAIFLSHGVLLLGISWVSHRMLARSRSTRGGRVYLATGCLIGSGAAFGGCALAGAWQIKLALVALGTGLPAVVFPLSAAMMGDVLPSASRNQVMTIILSLITLSAIPAPILAGRAIGAGTPAGWSLAMGALAGVAIFGGALALLLCDPDRSAARLSRR
jgi:MFS family permease